MDESSTVVMENDIKRLLRALFASCLNVPISQLDDEDSYFSLGLTSLIHHEVISDLTKVFGDLPSTVLFEYPNICLLAQYLATRGLPQGKVNATHDQ